MIEYKGETYGLGLLTPESVGLRVRSNMPLLSEFNRLLTKQEIDSLMPEFSGKRTKMFGNEWIENQLSHGSCLGWSGTLAYSKKRVLDGHARVRLSGTSLYAQINGGRDGGAILVDAMNAMVSKGVLPYEYADANQWHMSMIPSSAWAEAPRFRSFEPQVITTEQELLTVLLGLNGVAVVAVHVGNNFMQINSQGSLGSDRGPGNHAVHLDDVRYSSRLGRFEYRLPNTWGTGWGDNGVGWINWDDHLRDTRKYHEFFHMTGSVDDPNGTNPPPIK